MIAVCIVVIALTLVSIDMRADLVKKTASITATLLMLGICSTISASNVVLGLFINAIVIFIIVHQTVDNYKSPMYFPFVLSYIFILMSSPSTYEQLPGRLISIVFGSLYILLVQLVLNKGRFGKTILGSRKVIILSLKSQIANILDGKYDNTLESKVDNFSYTITKAIYDSKLKKKYLTNKNKGLLEVTLFMEEINHYLTKFKNNTIISEQKRDILIKFNKLLDFIEMYFSDTTDKKKFILEDVTCIVKSLNINLKENLDKNLIEMLNNLTNSLELTCKHTDKSQWKNDSLLKNWIKKININSFEFKFALKLSITVSLVIFLVEIFNISYGRWIIFPLIAIIQPYYDNTALKAKHRIIGTLLGIGLSTILFTIVREPSARVNVTLIAAYIGVFITKYQYSTCIVAISALGSSAISGGGIEILFYRLLFTLLGCGIAMLVNKYVSHYKIEDATKELKKEHEHLVHKIKMLDITNEEDHVKYNLIIKKRLIKQKIKEDN